MSTLWFSIKTFIVKTVVLTGKIFVKNTILGKMQSEKKNTEIEKQVDSEV